LKQLFKGYVEAKQSRHVLDYDDLLLYWFYLMEGDGEQVRRRFDHVLVDEYQDTNAIQAEIVRKIGKSVTVVGDDAQAIYAFRGATVRNILDFPSQFDPPATVIKLEQNYRSVQPILDASNAVIGLAAQSFRKSLFSERRSEQKPALVAAKDEQAQADYIVERVLEQREAGVPLHHQAVLMRTAHHSDMLEIELGKRNIPFVKYGGLKFLEAAHVKDLICILRWAENPRDDLAGFRVLQLIPGLGPAHARRILDKFANFQSLESIAVPAASKDQLPRLSALLRALFDATEWQGQVHMVREWDVVYVLNVVDGCIPSDMATGSKAEIEEERRLLYVAMTRARDHLYLIQPHRFYTGSSRRNGDRHIYAPRTRFIPEDLLALFDRTAAGVGEKEAAAKGGNNGARVNVAAKLREMWL